MLKILQARLQQYVNLEIPDVQAGFRKTLISSLLTMPKPLTLWITINCENSERDGNTRPPDLPLEKLVYRSGSKLELDMEQQTGSQ